MVDVGSVVSTSITIVKFILQWNEDKEQASADTRALGTTVLAVKAVLEPFDVATHGENNKTALTALMDRLNETKEILQATTSKFKLFKNFLFPAKVSERISQVNTEMMKFVHILSLGVTVHGFANNKQQPVATASALDFITSESTKRFWKAHFGEKEFSVPWGKLEEALIAEYPKNVDPKMLKDLQLRLDNFNTGSVSVCRLAEFVGSKALSEVLQEYQAGNNTPDGAAASAPIVDLTGQNIDFPILLWVDDKANNREVTYAKNEKGINVVVLTSTAEAKQWMKDNVAIIECEDPSKLRIITNNVRQGADTALDMNAGEEIIRFARGRRCTAPILVYCGDLKYTTYIENYDDVEACNTLKACRVFIDGLTK